MINNFAKQNWKGDDFFFQSIKVFKIVKVNYINHHFTYRILYQIKNNLNKITPNNLIKLNLFQILTIPIINWALIEKKHIINNQYLPFGEFVFINVNRLRLRLFPFKFGHGGEDDYHLVLVKGLNLFLRKPEYHLTPSSLKKLYQVWLILARWLSKSRWKSEKFTTTLNTTDICFL